MGLQRAVALGLVELLPDARQAGLADADAAVPHLNQQLAAVAGFAQAAAHEHAAVVGVADGVAYQVAQHAFQQHRIGVGHVLLAAEAQHQAFLESHRLEVQTQPREQLAQAQRRGVDVDAAGVDAGDVQQLAEQAFEGVDAFVDAVDQAGHLGVVAALAQGFGEQTHGMQRLAQVVAGGGEELGLGAVGGLGSAARFFGHATGFFSHQHFGAQAAGELVGAGLQRDRLA